ncbi:MAG: sulfotransferase domain-containing protein [Candidatus Sumerlaeaceae bacterium]
MMQKPTKHDLHKLGLLRRLTGPLRVLPDFLILGAQKAGTTTIYDNLVKHPLVLPADIKEVHFFDNAWAHRVNWYRAHFPTRTAMSAHEGSITGEGSPYYLFHPLVPARVKQVVPGAKFIMVLRNPVDRAYSHYQHEARKGREPLTFPDAIAQEAKRIAGEVDRLAADPNYRSTALQHFSYIERGKYAEQLRRWFNVFPREQFLILTSDELNRQFQDTMQKLYAFLGLPDHAIETPKRSNVGSYSKMEPETREQLLELFRPHNAELEKLIDRTLDWNK